MGSKPFKLLLPTIVFLLCAALPAAAQDGSISGRLTDAETGAPLVGASVEAVAGTRVVARVVSDANGQYRLAPVPPGTYTLVIVLLGYETLRLEGIRVVAGETSLAGAQLVASAFVLNPVVISASKRQEKVLNAPASVSVVDSRSIAERPVTTAVDHLRSTPGVDIVTQGVQSTNVVLRGFNNIFSGSLHALTDNRIAGVPSLRVNVLHFIPVTDDDIDHMEVVLGPGAALYGPNTADGVLHIITKSPLDAQGTTFWVAGGTQSVLSGAFRSSHLLSENFGIKLSGQYLQADEWPYTDPVEVTERQKVLADPDQFRAQLINATGIRVAEANARMARIGVRDLDVQRFGGDLRADWRVNDDLTAVFAAGFTRVGSGVELTGLGGAQAKDWTYSYVQARAAWRRLFAQVYANMSDAGETYLLRNGVPITDRSKLYVAQVQHGFSLGPRQDFTYGLDVLYTNPVTEGTINGKYEDDDQTIEFGAYLQSETSLTDRLRLVLAGRVDTHSALPDAIFSPRAGLVFQPTQTHAFRLTYNRAFSTPSSLNQFLDLGSVIPDPNAAALGYSLRIQGTGETGFRFRQTGGGYLMRSPFTPAGAGGPAQLVPANAAAYWQAAVQVLAQLAAGRGTPLPQQTIQYLSSLNPVGAIGSSFYHPATDVTGDLDTLALPDIEPIRESTTTSFEAGYKGVLGDRFLVAADLWYSQRKNLVTPLTIATPFVMLDAAETIAYLTQRFIQDLGMTPGDAQTQAIALTCGPGGIAACDQGLAAIPLGVISSPDVNASGSQLLMTYYNVDDQLDLYGVDLAATALISDSWSLGATVSLVNENIFETDLGQSVTLNAPKSKGALSLQYRNAEAGLNGELRARFNDGFPVRSGVYNGTLCIGGTEPGAEDCVDSYMLLDLTLGYRLPLQGASLQLSVQNLLDEDYRSFPGVPTIGRMALLRLKYEF